MDLSHAGLGLVGSLQLAKWLTEDPQSLRLAAFHAPWAAINRAGVEALLPVLAQAPRLQELDLSGNWIGDEGLVHVKHFLRSACCIRKLRLRWNGFTETTGFSLRSVLRTLGGKHLVELDLGGNWIGNAGALQVSRTLYRHKTLRLLRMDMTGMQSSGITALVDALHNNSVLEVLDVGGNSIGNNGASHLAKLLARTKGGAPLLSVSLQLNLLIGDYGAQLLASAIRSSAACRRLQQLDLGGNKIGNDGAAELVRMANNCPTLVEMWTDDNVGSRCSKTGTRTSGTCRTGVKNQTSTDLIPMFNNSVADALERWRGLAMQRRSAMAAPSWWRAPLRASVLRQLARSPAKEQLASTAAYYQRVYPLASQRTISQLTSRAWTARQTPLVWFTSAFQSFMKTNNCEGHAWSRCRLDAYFAQGLQPPRIERHSFFTPFRLPPGMCMRSEFSWSAMSRQQWEETYPYASGLPDHSWIEVTHTREQMGGAWLYLSPGSGLFWNNGRSLVSRNKVAASLRLANEALRLLEHTNESVANMWRAKLKLGRFGRRQLAASEWLADAIELNKKSVCATTYYQKRCQMFMETMRSNRTNRNDNCYGECSLKRAPLAVWFERAANGSGALEWKVDHLAASSVLDYFLYDTALKLGYDSIQLTMQPQVWCGLGWTTEILDLRVRQHKITDLVRRLSMRDPLNPAAGGQPCIVRSDNASRKAFHLVTYCEGSAMEQTARCLSDTIRKKSSLVTVYSQYPRHRFEACMAAE